MINMCTLSEMRKKINWINYYAEYTLIYSGLVYRMVNAMDFSLTPLFSLKVPGDELVRARNRVASRELLSFTINLVFNLASFSVSFLVHKMPFFHFHLLSFHASSFFLLFRSSLSIGTVCNFITCQFQYHLTFINLSCSKGDTLLKIE